MGKNLTKELRKISEPADDPILDRPRTTTPVRTPRHTPRNAQRNTVGGEGGGGGRRIVVNELGFPELIDGLGDDNVPETNSVSSVQPPVDDEFPDPSQFLAAEGMGGEELSSPPAPSYNPNFDDEPIDEGDDDDFPDDDAYDLVNMKKNEMVRIKLKDERNRDKVHRIPVYRICPYCEDLCARPVNGCKHTKCGNPSCGYWFCHICLRVPRQKIKLGQCYISSDNQIIEWECGEGQALAYTTCPTRHGCMVQKTQTRQNKLKWFVGMN